MIAAVIPARYGSKRLPLKNLRQFAGKPLVCYAVDIALQSVFIEEVYLTTESEIIKKAVRNSSPEVKIINRPKELSTDSADVISVLRHAAKKIDEDHKLDKQSIIVLLYPTYPLRTAELVDDVISHLYANGSGAIVTVVEESSSVFWYVGFSPDGRIHKLIPNSYYRKQEMPKVYRHAGAVVATYAEELQNMDQNGMSDNLYGFIVEDRDYCLEVDDLESFTRAEKIYYERKSKNG